MVDSSPATSELEAVEVLKRDDLGRVELVRWRGRLAVRRVPSGGRIPGSARLARFLARRERRILRHLAGLRGVPEPLDGPPGEFLRTYLAGVPLDRGPRPPDGYFADLRRLLDALHDRGVVHADLAKEANVLLCDDGTAALVDFQLALRFAPARGFVLRRLFDTIAREDLRHVLKHKRTRRPDLLDEEDRRRLASPSRPARAWAAFVKPVYHLVTRRLLGRPDREGAGLGTESSPPRSIL